MRPVSFLCVSIVDKKFDYAVVSSSDSDEFSSLLVHGEKHLKDGGYVIVSVSSVDSESTTRKLRVSGFTSISGNLVGGLVLWLVV